jgi:CheY-like chemotaxis protein
MKKILIAEDEYVTQQKIALIIEEMGYIPFISPNGKHAYETLQVNEGFNILITDIMMPEMDGRELIKLVREHSELKDLPIIIMSAFIGVKEISNLLQLGATIFQRKPIIPEEIQDNIKRYINKL